MPEASKASGTQWNTTASLRASASELAQKDHDGDYIVPNDLIEEAINSTQYEMQDLLRPSWDVTDTTYWSNANIGTYAPLVKSLHLQASRGRAILAAVGQGFGGSGALAEAAQWMITDAFDRIDNLIRNGALAVKRRTDDPDGRTAHVSSAGRSDPYFTMEDELSQPYTPASGTRDDDPY